MYRLWVPMILATAVGSGHAAASDKLRTEHVNVALVADHAAVVAGETTRIGVQFVIEPSWHIYWITHGDPGAPASPTSVKLTAPEGFVVSGPMFPPPAPHTSVEGDLFELEGSPVVLFDVKAPTTAVGSVTLKADVDWLVCKESCLPGGGELDLSLPIAKSAAEAAPANAKLFEAAAKALPLPVGQSKYVTLEGTISQDRVRPGDKFEIRLRVNIKAGHHIQAHKTPASLGLIGTYVFIEPAENLDIGKAVYPEGKARTLPGLGKVSEYSDGIVITVPVEATKDLTGTKAQVRGIIRYQACTDSGACFPPEFASFTASVPLAKAGEKITQISGPANAPVSPTPVGDASQAAAAPAPNPTPSESFNGGENWLVRTQRSLERLGIIGYLLLALMGGFLLNFMPCVLPVLSLKVVSFVKQAHESPLRVFALGLTFSAGILASFMVLAALAFIADKSWGGLFQHPQVTIGLAAIVTALALSLFGVFSVNPPQAINELGASVKGEGFGGTFMVGMLATVLGTACTAPFLSVVIATAIKLEPRALGIGLFAAAGVGMALPYLILSLNPSWLRFVPRAGPWMKSFEEIMGFLLLGTVIWLLYPLPAQITGKGTVWALFVILAVSFAAWLKGRVEFGAPVKRRLRYYAAILVVLVIGWWFPFRYVNTIAGLQAEANELRHPQVFTEPWQVALAPNAWQDKIPWQPYSRDTARKCVERGFAVFVDYTADWCASCKTNEASSLNIDSTRRLMLELKVVPFKADFTNPDAEIEEDFKRLGKSGVPIYAIYRPGDWDHPETLPELLTPGIVHDALRRAGASRPK